MSSIQTLKCLTINPTAKHTATVIFLHGLGDSGAGWAPVARLFGRNPKLAHIKFILPNAPSQRVTLNMGMAMPSWFDIKTLDADLTMVEAGVEDQDGMLSSAASVSRLITKEIEETELEAKRIVVGGFSQGAALSLLTGLTSERKLGGLVSLSGWLPMSAKIKSMMTDSARNIPIFFGHGTDDEVVQFEYGKKSYDLLKTTPFKFKDATEEGTSGLTWKEYDGLGHSSAEQELADLSEWLARTLPATE